MRCVVVGSCLSCTGLGSPSLATPAPQQATDQGGTDRDTYDHRCPSWRPVLEPATVDAAGVLGRGIDCSAGISSWVRSLCPDIHEAVHYRRTEVGGHKLAEL